MNNDANIIQPQPMRLNAVHPEYAKFSPAEIEAKVKAKLKERIRAGQQQALAALRRIEQEVPADRVVPVQKVWFDHDEGGVVAVLGEDRLHIHKHARGQFSTRLGFNQKFMNELIGQGDWGNALVAHNLTELARHGSGENMLVRSVGGKVRGVLGSSYGTEDSRPALDALLTLAKEVGAVVVEGTALDTRCSFKIMKGEPIEIFPGEWAIVGLDYRTSDYGHGAREFCGWIERLLCLNGATVTASFRKVHLGARIKDDVDYSQRTRKLRDAASASAARDIAKALLGDEAIDRMVSLARTANAAELDPDRAMAALKGAVNKSEEKKIIEKFNSPDIELLPAGNTTWRFGQAVSWLANEVEDADRKLDLQRLAGEIIENPGKVAKAAA